MGRRRMVALSARLHELPGMLAPTYTVAPLYLLGVKTRTLLILAAITGLAIIMAFTLLVLSFPN